MTSRRIAMLRLAAALAVSSAPAFAQGVTEPAPKPAAAPKKVPAKKTKPAVRAAAAPATRSPILGSGGEDEAASLERRRRAFFADKPDEGGAEQGARPAAGVTLGGSGGIRPGMGFSF